MKIQMTSAEGAVRWGMLAIFAMLAIVGLFGGFRGEVASYVHWYEFVVGFGLLFALVVCAIFAIVATILNLKELFGDRR